MKETKENEIVVVPDVVNHDNFTSKALISGIDVLRGTQLIKQEDFEFLRQHSEKYEKRFRTRGIFRSRTEMVSGVLNDSEHPTVDSKYWQAIGEQNVHLTELISLSYESKKLEADSELLEAEIEELEEIISKETNIIEIKKLQAKLKKKRVELAQMQFGMTQQKKIAQERLREVKTWEGIIDELEPHLEFGDEDFGLHHAKRYLLRYQQRMENLEIMDPEARESVVTHYKSFIKNVNDNESPLPIGMQTISNPSQISNVSKNSTQQKIVQFPDGQSRLSQQVDYPSLDAMGQDDPVAKEYFDRKVRKILVGAPHRNKGDRNATNFFALQPPTGFNCTLEEPYGMTVADARNFLVQRAIDEEYDYLFMVDDDVIIPRNALVKLIHLNADVAGGIYYKKYLPLESVGMHENDKGQPISIDPKDYSIGDLIHNTLVLPSGCTLIKVDVLKRIQPPWYKTITVNNRPTMTEDTYICGKLRKIGIDVITDTGIQCIHIDYNKGIFYGHPELVDFETNTIKSKYRDYLAI